MSLKFVSCCNKIQFTPRLCNKYFKICYKLEVVTSGHRHCTQFCWWFLLRDWGPIWFLVINTVFNLSCALQWHCSTDDLSYNNLWKISLNKGVIWSPSCDYGFCTLGKETDGPTYDLKFICKYQELTFKRKSFMCTGFICSVVLKDTWRGSSLDSEGVVLIG